MQSALFTCFQYADEKKKKKKIADVKRIILLLVLFSQTVWFKFVQIKARHGSSVELFVIVTLKHFLWVLIGMVSSMNTVDSCYLDFAYLK